jgi:hypothetical protein
MTAGLPRSVRSLIVAGSLLLVAAPAAAAVLGHHAHAGAPHAGQLMRRPHARTRAGVTSTISAGRTLLSASCAAPGAASCLSVGDYELNTGPLPLAEPLAGPELESDPGHLIKTRGPVPAVATSAPRGSSAVFTATGCPARRNCMAVGARFGGDGRSAPLAELWSNARPHLLAVPRPAARGGIGSRFSGVSCISPRDCVAVGDNQRRSIVVPLAQIWNGASWRAIPPPAVPRARVSLLTGVSCTRANACTAVGSYLTASGGNALAERWDGRAWRIQPTAGSAPSGSVLSAVSCPSGTGCVAVGAAGPTGAGTLAELWNGTAWRVLPTPNPPGSFMSMLSAVACRSMTNCTAVGYDRHGASGYATLIETWNGTSWSIQPSPDHYRVAELYGVSCPASRVCFAVGGFAARSGKRMPLVEVWNGASWRVRRPLG